MSRLYKVSIITINFNNREGLKRTIESVRDQDYSNLEYIVIDGGSTDGSRELIHDMQKCMAFWLSERDNGIYEAMNKGLIHATGDYCLFLNSGDCLHDSSSLSHFVARLSDEDIIMGRVLCVPSGNIGYADIKEPLTLWDFYMGCPVPHPASLIKRNLFDNYSYDESLKIVSDWKFFLQVIILEGCSYKIVDTIVTDFEENGISNDRLKCDKEREVVLNEIIQPAILLDYKRFENGKDFIGDNYDTFYSELKRYNKRCGKLIYAFSVVIVRVLSFFFSSLRFSKKYSLNYKGNK